MTPVKSLKWRRIMFTKQYLRAVGTDGEFLANLLDLRWRQQQSNQMQSTITPIPGDNHGVDGVNMQTCDGRAECVKRG